MSSVHMGRRLHPLEFIAARVGESAGSSESGLLPGLRLGALAVDGSRGEAKRVVDVFDRRLRTIPDPLRNQDDDGTGDQHLF